MKKNERYSSPYGKETERPHEGEPRYSFLEKLHGWRLGISIDGESVMKAVVCGLLIVFFALIQTTLFTKFRLFGVVPDLMLPLVIAISMTEHEKWGAICGIVAAFVIDSLGSTGLSILPILYMLCGYICGVLTVHYFRDSILVRGLYTLVSSGARAVFSLIIIFATQGNVTILPVLTEAVIPELFVNIIFAALPHVAAKICLRRFNRTRDEKVH